MRATRMVLCMRYGGRDSWEIARKSEMLERDCWCSFVAFFLSFAFDNFVMHTQHKELDTRGVCMCRAGNITVDTEWEKKNCATYTEYTWSVGPRSLFLALFALFVLTFHILSRLILLPPFFCLFCFRFNFISFCWVTGWKSFSGRFTILSIQHKALRCVFYVFEKCYKQIHNTYL